MCMPEYLYGLILIGSLEGEAARGAARSIDSSRERETSLSPRREKKSRTMPSDAGSLVPAGA